MPVALTYLCAGMLFLGAVPLPYGYYTLLRLVACITFAWAAYVALENKHSFLPWAYGALALVFNPIFKVSFEKDIWIFIDVASAVFLLLSSKFVKAGSQHNGVS
ncbi:MAG: hypothetical protein C0422_05010 [Alcaligenaceae bacterium]|nr:hypothetical protein [Alcaligenaceae bacterium]